MKFKKTVLLVLLVITTVFSGSQMFAKKLLALAAQCPKSKSHTDSSDKLRPATSFSVFNYCGVPYRPDLLSNSSTSLSTIRNQKVNIAALEERLNALYPR